MSFQNARDVDASHSIFNDIGTQMINYNGSNKIDINHVLAPVIDAAYSRGGPVSKCFPGTRVEVIAEIVERLEIYSDHPICWLKGPAGSGKSAISQAIAKRYADQKRLAASFFFLRGAGNRSIIARLIPTISHQLCISIPETKAYIQRVLETDPYITSQSLEHQFQKLVVDPILESRNPATTSQGQTPIARESHIGQFTPSLPTQMRPLVTIIVIDGLDECDDQDAMGEFIEVIIDAFRMNPGLPLQVLIASRIEEHIRQELETDVADAIVHHLSLEDFDAHDDILKFFRSSFNDICKKHRRVITYPWPSEQDLQSLAVKSEGSFIVAATLMDVIRKGRDLPQDRLQMALAAGTGLDTLYTQVLSDAHRDCNFDRVIGTIMLLRKPLSITFLAQLLQLQARNIVHTLMGIQSILMIPGDDDEAVRLFHTSLRDFLTSRPRSDTFFIDPPTRHFSIAIDCLTLLMKGPKQGIFYDGGQKYACLNWCYHLCQCLINGGDHVFRASLDDSLMRSLQDFASQSLDSWVNTVLADGYKEPLNTFNLVLSTLNRLPDCPQEVVQTLEDFGRCAKRDIEDFAEWLYHENNEFDLELWDDYIEEWRQAHSKAES